MTPPSRMVSVPPQAHIVWNEDRSEGVIFVDQDPGATAWPLTAADDAHQASTGHSRRPGIGSALAEAFFEAYEDDEDRPIQTIPSALLTAAPVREEGGAVDWSYDLTSCPRSEPFLIAYADGDVRMGHYLDNSKSSVPWEGIRPLFGAERWDAKIVAWAKRPALATREEAPAEAGEPKYYAAFMAEDGALRAQPPAREDAQPVAWTGSGSLARIKGRAGNFQGYIYGTPDAAHPIALYTRPAPDALRVAVEAFMPTNIDLTNTNLRDDQVLPCDVTVGELRAISAALQAEQGAK